MSGEFVKLLQAEVERIEGEIARLQAGPAPLRALLETYNGKPVAPAARRAPKTPAKKHDWALGLRLWKARKSVPEIANAVGVTEAGVYYQSKKWPKRPQQPRTGRPTKAKTDGRRVLTHSVECPSCGEPTSQDPCSRCNTVLPTSLGGAGTRARGED